MKKLRPIMFVGTGSDVGKSIINTAFCRIFLQDGYTPAPFKAQNMSLNSYATPDGLEIGRAQAVQAESCGIECSVHMNPVLLKPTNNMNSQIVLNGKPWANKSAREYFIDTNRDFLFSEAMKSFDTLQQTNNPIVIEGAGSISELNLRDKDITNMRVALRNNADVYLIADIDKGGVFGSVYGTIQLLPENERKLIKGIIINKFRGDISLFEQGKQQLEQLCNIPVVSIIPYFRDIHIEDEDSVVLKKRNKTPSNNKTNIAVILLNHMSNFTDFNSLENITEINLFYTNNIEDIINADIIIIPGSKNTINDMQYLNNTGISEAIKKAHKQGKSVYGICGGFQMMGQKIDDPKHIESNISSQIGLGILPVETTLTETKTTQQCTFKFLNQDTICKGYEIHMGETTYKQNATLCIKSDNKQDGYFLDPKTWGTYIHGIFDNRSIINNILEISGQKSSTNFNPYKFKSDNYNKLASLVRKHTNLEYIYNSLKEK